MMAAPFSSEIPELLQSHFDMLQQGSGIAVDLIRERRYRSILGKKELASYRFSTGQRRAPGLLLPVHGPDGRNGLYCYRPDLPRQDARGHARKYELPAGETARLDVPPRCRPHLANPAIPLWLTEGQKKADALASRELCAAALLGVWNFKGRNDFGGVTLLADFDYIAWNGRTVNVVFDSDVMQKTGPREALERLTEHLQRKGAVVNRIYLPASTHGQKVGVDDFLLVHSVAELEALVHAPKPETKPAAPVVRLLDEAPTILDRPLALINGTAYVATWLWIETEIREGTNKAGEVIRFDPPHVERSHALHVVASDGTVYGPASNHALADVLVTIKLAEPVREGKEWRAAAVQRYRSGARPDPVDVFRRLVNVYAHFIDFERSFADQSGLCELSALLSLQTWFAPAYTVLGYPWPNGERGSGKTQWGIVWAHTSYLGEVLLSSGSFAALRDLANYGASLMFDDAEVLSDPKRCDPQKRELFLAGNRRGASVPLKEQQPDGTWQTRWVNAFCPRAFTAISLPDPVLASRSVVLPLVRTADTTRGNRDPADLARWPCDRRALLDDLWALAVWLLPEAAQLWGELENEDSVIGREFEPWRAVLAGARLLERHGVAGLEGRIRQVMRAYQQEKPTLLDADRTVWVVKALLALCDDTSDACDTHDTRKEAPTITAEEVSRHIKAAAEEEEREADWATPSRIGRTLATLRFKKAARTGERRGWVIPRSAIYSLGRAYGLLAIGEGERRQEKESAAALSHANDTSPPLSPSVMSVTSVTSATSAVPVATPPRPVKKTTRDWCRYPSHDPYDYRRLDGSWGCGVCHPLPAAQRKATQDAAFLK